MYKEIKLSVRHLVEFIGRGGDLDTRRLGGSMRAVAGTRAHQKVQKSYGDNYVPEVALEYKTTYKGYSVHLQGRADGVLIEGGQVIIDEIKSTTRDVQEIAGQNHLHWGQVKCYGYFYCMDQGVDEIILQLTYYNIETTETKIQRELFTQIELRDYVYHLLEQYTVWVEFITDWQTTRNASIESLAFPFPTYRKGQRRFVVATYRTITAQKKGYFQAPTGIGKTVSALFPALKAMNEGYVDKIFYLTAKTITRQVVEETINLMLAKGLALKAITLTAKDKVCFMDDTRCNPDYCPYAKGHYDRVNTAVLAVLEEESLITRTVVENYAQTHQVCPFELSLDVAMWTDCVICDYNYAFDPRVYLRRFFEDSNNNYVFLVDEGHNLVDRGREMFSAELNKQAFLDVRRLMKDKSPSIVKAINHINTYFLKQKKLCGEKGFLVSKKLPEDILPLLQIFLWAVEKWFEDTKQENPELLHLFFAVFQFVKIGELFTHTHVTYTEVLGTDVKLKIFCLDPAPHLREALNRAKGAVFFSATLSPLSFYKELLGGNDDDYVMSLPSPFDKENVLLMAHKGISTYYREREESYDPIVKALYAFVKGKKGNYFAFFPSYIYMNRVLERFRDKYPEVALLVQQGEMSETERDDFLRQFKAETDDTLLAFGVLGGIFSESIDLVGERLIGAAVISVGLPQICLERDLIKEHFNYQGFEYAYMYPGFNKVLQGIGRVVRTTADKGAILLIGKRYHNHGYRRLFPSHWADVVYVAEPKDIESRLRQFWG